MLIRGFLVPKNLVTFLAITNWLSACLTGNLKLSHLALKKKLSHLNLLGAFVYCHPHTKTCVKRLKRIIQIFGKESKKYFFAKHRTKQMKTLTNTHRHILKIDEVTKIISMFMRRLNPRINSEKIRAIMKSRGPGWAHSTTRNITG